MSRCAVTLGTAVGLLCPVITSRQKIAKGALLRVAPHWPKLPTLQELWFFLELSLTSFVMVQLNSVTDLLTHE